MWHAADARGAGAQLMVHRTLLVCGGPRTIAPEAQQFEPRAAAQVASPLSILCLLYYFFP